MDEKKMSPVAQSLIFFSGIAGMFLIAAIFKNALHPGQEGIVVTAAVSGFSLMLGVTGSLLVKGKSKSIKVVVFLVGLVVFFATSWLLKLGYIGLGVFVAGFFFGDKEIMNKFKEK